MKSRRGQSLELVVAVVVTIASTSTFAQPQPQVYARRIHSNGWYGIPERDHNSYEHVHEIDNIGSANFDRSTPNYVNVTYEVGFSMLTWEINSESGDSDDELLIWGIGPEVFPSEFGRNEFPDCSNCWNHFSYLYWHPAGDIAGTREQDVRDALNSPNNPNHQLGGWLPYAEDGSQWPGAYFKVNRIRRLPWATLGRQRWFTGGGVWAAHSNSGDGAPHSDVRSCTPSGGSYLCANRTNSAAFFDIMYWDYHVRATNVAPQ